jgi:hypothetical protein
MVTLVRFFELSLTASKTSLLWTRDFLHQTPKPDSDVQFGRPEKSPNCFQEVIKEYLMFLSYLLQGRSGKAKILNIEIFSYALSFAMITRVGEHFFYMTRFHE